MVDYHDGKEEKIYEILRQKRKNIGLLIALSLIVGSSIVLHFSTTNSNNLGVDKKMFQLQEKQEITDVILEGKDVNNHFKFHNGRWFINDSLLLDQSMRNVFFSILSQIEIRRPVPENKQDSLVGLLKQQGIHTTITFGNNLVKDYWVAGNKEHEISWMMANQMQVPYQIHIPGYQSYIAGIFNVPISDWRSRFVFNSNFALLQKIELGYIKANDNLTLVFKNNFFTIPGQQSDSTKIANFLDQVAYLQADQFLSKEDLNPEEDSLVSNNIRFAQLSLLNSSGGKETVIFYRKLPSSPFMLARTNDGSLCKFSYKRVKSLFKTSIDFE